MNLVMRPRQGGPCPGPRPQRSHVRQPHFLQLKKTLMPSSADRSCFVQNCNLGLPHSGHSWSISGCSVLSARDFFSCSSCSSLVRSHHGGVIRSNTMTFERNGFLGSKFLLWPHWQTKFGPTTLL